MIVHRTAGRPSVWFIAFFEDSKTSWVHWLVRGKFKHCFAFGFSPEAGAWVVVDAALNETSVTLLPDSQESLMLLGRWTAGAAVLKIDAPTPDPIIRARFRPLYCCTSSVASIIGLKRSALRPDALYRLLIRENAERLPVVVLGPSPTT